MAEKTLRDYEEALCAYINENPGEAVRLLCLYLRVSDASVIVPLGKFFREKDPQSPDYVEFHKPVVHKLPRPVRI